MTAAATKIKHNKQKAADDLYFMGRGETKELLKLKNLLNAITFWFKIPDVVCVKDSKF